MGTLWSLRDGHGQKERTGRVWSLNDAQLGFKVYTSPSRAA